MNSHTSKIAQTFGWASLILLMFALAYFGGYGAGLHTERDMEEKIEVEVELLKDTIQIIDILGINAQENTDSDVKNAALSVRQRLMDILGKKVQR